MIELIVTLAIAAILATLAVPAFNQAMLGSKLNSMANGFVASAQLARSEAIKRNAAVTLCARGDDNISCGASWENGWLVMASGAPIHTQGPLPNGFLLSGNVTSIDFQPAGVGATCTKLTLKNTNYTSQERVVTVSTTGRPNAAKATTFSCS